MRAARARSRPEPKGPTRAFSDPFGNGGPTLSRPRRSRATRPAPRQCSTSTSTARVADAWRPMGPHEHDFPGLLFGIVGNSAGGVSFVEVTLEPHE